MKILITATICTLIFAAMMKEKNDRQEELQRNAYLLGRIHQSREDSTDWVELHKVVRADSIEYEYLIKMQR